MEIINKKWSKLILLFFLAFLPLSSSIYAASIERDVTTSVTVPAHTTDYSLSVESVTTGPSFSPDQTIEYKITYETLFSYPSNITLTAGWSQGTIDGNSTPSVDILNYVVGSAGNAYGSSSPVVDTQNRQITWTINSLPGSSAQTVNFKVKTNSNYTGDKKVNFTISSSLTGIGGTSIDASDNTNYFVYSAPAATPTPAPSTTTPTPTTSPSTTTSNLTIDSIDLRSISSTKAAIIINTTPASTISLSYGKSADNLNRTITSLSLSTQTLINLDTLDPDTGYYFVASAKDSSGNKVSSDIFTFKTALASVAPQVVSESFIAASAQTIISKPSGDNSQSQIVLPVNTPFEFSLRILSKSEIKKATAVVRNKNVLGFSTVYAEANTETVDLVQTQSGIFTGRLKSNPSPGSYEIYARISDINGNITEARVSELIVVPRLRVFSKETGDPIEGARVLVYIKDPKTGNYSVLPPTAIAGLNPLFTNTQGEADLVLPQSDYKILVSEIGFKDQEDKFTVGPHDTDGYPQVYLEKQNIGVLQVIRHVSTTTQDIFITNTAAYLNSLTGSLRFFNLVSALILLTLIILSFLAFISKTSIPLFSLPSYFSFYVQKWFGKTKSLGYIEGFVHTNENTPLPNAHVYLLDLTNEEIIQRTETNSKGHFFFKKKLEKAGILVMGKGYKTSGIYQYKSEGLAPVIKVENIETKQTKIVIGELSDIFSKLLGFSFEVLIVLSLFLEFLFLNTLGITRTLPFLTASVLNIFLWISFLRVRHHTI